MKRMSFVDFILDENFDELEWNVNWCYTLFEKAMNLIIKMINYIFNSWMNESIFYFMTPLFLLCINLLKNYS